MKDLQILHLANKATIEMIDNLGFDTTVLEFTVEEFLGSERLTIGPDVVPETVIVKEDGLPLRRYSGPDPLPLGGFRLELQDGNYVVALYKPLDVNYTIEFSTSLQTGSTLFSVRGKGLLQATNAFVADQEVELQILSDTDAIIRVPTALASLVNFDSLSIVSSTDSVLTSSEILFDLSTRNKVAAGPQVLLQRFLTLLMSPEAGNLTELLPRSVPASSLARTLVFSRAVTAVNAAQKKFILTTPPEAPPEERLLQAAVESVDVNSNTGTIEINIRLRSAAGTTISSPLRFGG